MVINFLPVDSKRDAIQLSDKPRLRNDPILYSRRSWAAVSRRRDLILRAAHCHSSRAISSSVPERTTSNSRVPGYRNDRCLGPNVAEENGGREKGQNAVEKERKTGIESWECIVSYLASRSKLLRGGLLPFFICRKLKDHGGREKATWGRQGGHVSSCSAKLRSRVFAAGQSWYPSNGHDVCLFRSECHNTPTTDHSRVLTSVMHLSRMQGTSNLTKRQSIIVDIINY